MAGISQFKAQITGDIARANRFEVVVEFPAFAGSSELSRKTQFMANSTSLPGSTLGVTEVPFRGRTLKLPGDRTFDEWSVSFINDTSFELRDAFEAWQNAMNSYSSNVGLENLNDAFSTVTAYQLDNNDNRVKAYTLSLAWPSTVGAIELAQDTNDAFEMFEVTFVYSDLNSENVTN
jgi:hypothetical protein